MATVPVRQVHHRVRQAQRVPNIQIYLFQSEGNVVDYQSNYETESGEKATLKTGGKTPKLVFTEEFVDHLTLKLDELRVLEDSQVIPISPKQKLKKKIGKVEYMFWPPVGDKEIELVNMQSESDLKTIRMAKANYFKAVELLEMEYTGKRKPKKKEWQNLIAQKIEELIDRSGDTKARPGAYDNANNTLDIAMCGWRGIKKDVKLPDFPDHPSKFLPLSVKGALYHWYLGQMNLQADELKN